MATSDTSGPRRARDADATRLALLNAARRRFVFLGFDRTTTRDVAADAGVNVALINRYFGGKQGLFEAVIEGSPVMTNDSDPPIDIVAEFYAGLADGAWPEFGNHPLLLILRDSAVDERIEQLRRASMDDVTQRILEWSGLQAAQASGVERRAAQLRAQLVVALFNGVVAMRAMTPLDPLASAGVDELAPAINDAIEALVGRRPSV